MSGPPDESEKLQAVALQNVQSILLARQRADQELLRTKEALEEETRILEVLNETGAKLASNLDLQSVLQAVTDAGTQLSGAQFGAFFYTATSAEGEVLTLFTLSGAPREAFERFGHPRATPIFAPTFAGEGVVRIADVLRDPRYGRWAPHHGMPAGHLPVRSYLAVPVITRSGEVIGGLFFGHADPDVFTDRAERLIVGVAGQAAIAVDNARLYEAARRAADERASLLETERAARVELERLGVVKDEFLATLSHELRTPLNAVLGWSTILLGRVGQADPDTRRGLDAIVRNARAQAQLIDDLLDMNRIMSGKIRLDVQCVELVPVIEGALEAVRPSADAKSIQLRQRVEDDIGTIVADAARLQQVIWNLLSNAVKFTPEGGAVELTVRRLPSHVVIAVGDNGLGIAPEFLPHIFERFRQADSSTTRRFGGLGLGLSIVKQLVELHGGAVNAESPGAGGGSTFTVTLPVRVVPERVTPSNPMRPATSAAPSVPVSLEGITVVVVDDEPDARELVGAVLTSAMANVFTAGRADEGLELVRAKRPDIIVSDIGMPDRDGYDFMRDVRRLEAARGGRTPAIALTAFARSEDRTRAMLAGYQVHVSKPIEPQELVATVKSLAVNSTRSA